MFALSPFKSWHRFFFELTHFCGFQPYVSTSQRQVTFLEVSKFAQESGITFLETSALTGDNVEEVFLMCARDILTRIENGLFLPPSIAIFVSSCLFIVLCGTQVRWTRARLVLVCRLVKRARAVVSRLTTQTAVTLARVPSARANGSLVNGSSTFFFFR